MDKDKIIYDLWKLLDDIDTASDMFKDAYKSFADYTYKKQQERHKIVSEEFIDELYTKYYPREVEPI